MEASCCLAGQVEVEQVRICYGGVAPKCIMATNAQAALEGQAWSQATLDAALLAVAKDVNITPDAPGLAATAATAAVATVALCCAVLCCAVTVTVLWSTGHMGASPFTWASLMHPRTGYIANFSHARLSKCRLVQSALHCSA